RRGASRYQRRSRASAGCIPRAPGRAIDLVTYRDSDLESTDWGIRARRVEWSWRFRTGPVNRSPCSVRQTRRGWELPRSLGLVGGTMAHGRHGGYGGCLLLVVDRGPRRPAAGVPHACRDIDAGFGSARSRMLTRPPDPREDSQLLAAITDGDRE